MHNNADTLADSVFKRTRHTHAKFSPFSKISWTHPWKILDFMNSCLPLKKYPLFPENGHEHGCMLWSWVAGMGLSTPHPWCEQVPAVKPAPHTPHFLGLETPFGFYHQKHPIIDLKICSVHLFATLDFTRSVKFQISGISSVHYKSILPDAPVHVL